MSVTPIDIPPLPLSSMNNRCSRNFSSGKRENYYSYLLNTNKFSEWHKRFLVVSRFPEILILPQTKKEIMGREQEGVGKVELLVPVQVSRCALIRRGLPWNVGIYRYFFKFYASAEEKLHLELLNYFNETRPEVCY